MSTRSKLRSSRPLGVESLEDRRLMAGRVDLSVPASQLVNIPAAIGSIDTTVASPTRIELARQQAIATQNANAVNFTFDRASGELFVQGTGTDQLDGELGDDLLFGEDDPDTLVGGEGNDQIFGGAGNDQVNGGAGNDAIWGEGGDDFLFGGDGDDRLLGGLGLDTLYGQNGNDYLDGGIDGITDKLFGGMGIDTYRGDSSSLVRTTAWWQLRPYLELVTRTEYFNRVSEAWQDDYGLQSDTEWKVS